MTINIRARGVELTPAIKEYVEEKMQALEKYAEVTHMDVEVGMSSHHHHKGDVFQCKVVVDVAGEVVCVEKEEEDLYKAIDKVKDHLRESLADLKRLQAEQATGRSDGS